MRLPLARRGCTVSFSDYPTTFALTQLFCLSVGPLVPPPGFLRPPQGDAAVRARGQADGGPDPAHCRTAVGPGSDEVVSSRSCLKA